MLALVNTHTAAALQYGYYRNFENRTETVLLYDLGATSVSAALVRFSGQHGNTGGSKSKGPGYVPPPALLLLMHTASQSMAISLPLRLR